MRLKFIGIVMILEIAMCVFAMSAKASTMDIKKSDVTTEAYVLSININSLGKYLDLTQEQKEEVAIIEKSFSDAMQEASLMEDDNVRQHMMDNAIDLNLKNLKIMLDGKQYHKYLKVLNATLNNRGLK